MTWSRSSSPTPNVLLLTAGDPRRLTGGNIYDAHVVAALRRAGIRVRLVRVDSESVPRAAVTIIDSIAFARVGRVAPRIGGRVIALVHMPIRGSASVLERADRIVAVSPALAGLIGRGATVIRPGSDGVPRVPRDRRPDDKLRVLCVAHGERAKGLDVLARAARSLDGIHIEVVGERGGPHLALARRGPLHGVGLARAYANADVVVVPSRAEGYGIAASEAIAHGKPVVASDLPSLRAIIGSAGLLIPPSDVHALARALARVSDPRVRRRLSARARVRARSLPRWRDTEEAFVALVEKEMQRSAIGGDHMPPRGVKSKKRTRQYEHIKRSELKRGRSAKVAKRIAAATTNKTRRKKGETKGRRKKS